MADWFRDVYEFHRTTNSHIGDRPAVPDVDISEMREDLVYEESCELIDALRLDDIPGIADAVADLIYVALGTAVSYGIDLRPVWDAVHAANMAKVGGPVREDGKILKPDGWEPPDVAGILAKQPPLRDALCHVIPSTNGS